MRLRAARAALLLAGSPAVAQAAEAVPGTPAIPNDNLKARFVAQAPDDDVASQLVGLSIRTGANATVGAVADVVFDDERGIKSSVVSVGGFLGLNAKYVAAAPETLQLTRRDGGALDAVIDTDTDQLRAAPEDVDLGSEPTKT